MSISDSASEPLDIQRLPRGQLIWSPMRTKLLSWLRENAKSLASAYEGAVKILGDTSFPGRTQFISHAVRDIVNVLPSALDPQDTGKRVEYANHLDEIQESWKSPGQNLQPDSSPVSSEDFTISMKVAKRINKLVAEHQESRQRPSKYELLFRILMKEDPLKATLNRRTVEAFKKTSKWFQMHAHFPNAPSPPVEEQEFVWRFKEFECAIYALVERHLEGSYFVGIGELNDILQQANR